MRAKFSIISPLQLDVLSLAHNLRAFLKEIGPRPDADWGKGDKTAPEWMAIKFAERRNAQAPWLLRLKHKYEGDFAHNITKTIQALGEHGINVDLLIQYAQTVTTENDVLRVADVLEDLALQLNRQETKREDLDRDTIAKYEAMTLEAMKRILTSPEAKKALDEAYERGGIRKTK